MDDAATKDRQVKIGQMIDRLPFRPPIGLLAMTLLRYGRRAAFTFVSICGLAATSPAPASAQPTAESPPRAAESDPAAARALLMRMAEYLSAAPGYSVNLEVGFDVVQASGQKIEFGQSRRVLVRRPNGLRIATSLSSGARQEIFYNGTELVLFDPRENVFARLDRAGSIDDIVSYLVGELQTPVPLSALLLTTLPQEMAARVTDVALVEQSAIAGVPVDHLVARMADIDVQIWIRRGDQPLPLRIVLTYRTAAGQPQFRATFNEWNFSPTSSAADFNFVPPAGAEAVAVMVPTRSPSATNSRRR